MMGEPVWIGGEYFHYRERMQINESIWIFIYDTEIEEQVDRLIKEIYKSKED